NTPLNGFRRLYSKGFQGVCLRLLEKKKKCWQQKGSPTLDIIEPLLDTFFELHSLKTVVIFCLEIIVLFRLLR
ncbi:hypothetical protein, partial [Enterococcus raffinosus]|uniref:hypothetical protein n=1 Tax=Enterococcus raffinosus TaxID=71452 RepID=UPI001C8CC3CE